MCDKEQKRTHQGEQRFVDSVNDTIAKGRALEQLRDDFPLIVALQQFRAKLAMERYKAYRAAGFDDDQAMYLCKEGE